METPNVLAPHFDTFVRQLNAEGAAVDAAAQQILSLGFFTGCVAVLQEIEDTLLSPLDGAGKTSRVQALIDECADWVLATGDLLEAVKRAEAGEQQAGGG